MKRKDRPGNDRDVGGGAAFDAAGGTKQVIVVHRAAVAYLTVLVIPAIYIVLRDDGKPLAEG